MSSDALPPRRLDHGGEQMPPDGRPIAHLVSVNVFGELQAGGGRVRLAHDDATAVFHETGQHVLNRQAASMVSRVSLIAVAP